MRILVESTPSLVAHLQPLLGDPRGADGVQVTAPDALDARLEALWAGGAVVQAVVLGPSVAADDACALAERLRAARPETGVVLVREQVDVAVLAGALRAGVRDVVALEDTAALREALERTRALAESWERRAAPAPADHALTGPGGRADGRVVTVFSLKGGVGKSMVATNLAALLADGGRTVCLVDLDVAGGDVALMLQLTPQHTLAELDDLGDDPDEAGVRSLLTASTERLSVLAAPTHLGASVDAARVGRLLERLRTMVDVVVVDTSGSFDDHAVHALDHTDALLLVGTPDVPSLKSLKLAVGTIDLLGLPRERRHLVLNRVEPRVGLSRTDVEETLGMSVSVSVPASSDVVSAVNRGEPIVRSHRGHAVSKALARLVEVVPGGAAATPGAGPTGGGRRRASRTLLRSRKQG